MANLIMLTYICLAMNLQSGMMAKNQTQLLHIKEICTYQQTKLLRSKADWPNTLFDKMLYKVLLKTVNENAFNKRKVKATYINLDKTFYKTVTSFFLFIQDFNVVKKKTRK